MLSMQDYIYSPAYISVYLNMGSAGNLMKRHLATGAAGRE